MVVVRYTSDGERRWLVTSKAPEVEDDNFEVVRSGKRKGKKGKKVADPSLLLGFNVSSSNQILMGKIHHIKEESQQKGMKLGEVRSTH